MSSVLIESQKICGMKTLDINLERESKIGVLIVSMKEILNLKHIAPTKEVKSERPDLASISKENLNKFE